VICGDLEDTTGAVRLLGLNFACSIAGAGAK